MGFSNCVAFSRLGGPCRTQTPDAKEQLVHSLKGASVDGYDFATREDETQVVTSLDNSAMRNPIKLPAVRWFSDIQA